MIQDYNMTLEVVFCASLFSNVLMSGFVFGIYYELCNYRRDIKDNIDYITKSRHEIKDNFDAQGKLIASLEAKVYDMEMYVKNVSTRR